MYSLWSSLLFCYRKHLLTYLPKSCINPRPPIRATWPLLLSLLDLIILILFSKEYRSVSSSLCSFLHSFVTSSLLGRNIFLNTLFSDPLSLRSSVMWATKFYIRTKQQTKLKFRIYQSSNFWIAICKTKDSAFPDFNLLSISSWIVFWFIEKAPLKICFP